VMVDGFQKLRGNAPVKPVPWKAAASGAAPSNGTPMAVSAGASGAASAPPAAPTASAAMPAASSR